MSAAQSFVDKYFEAAYAAYSKYGVHPIATLSQGAYESGWGTSTNAIVAKNFFGVTKGSAIANEYWFGIWRKSATGHKYRVYPSPTNSFLDFARIIKTSYAESAAVSSNITAYANQIANSGYHQTDPNKYKANLLAIGDKLSHFVECAMSKKTTHPEQPIFNNATGDSCPLFNIADNESGKEINVYFFLIITILIILLPGGIFLSWLLKK